MSKNCSDNSSFTKEDRLFVSQLKELENRAYYTGRPIFTDFLDTREQAIAETCVGKGAVFFGGYDDAERRMIGFMPEYEAEFPITALTVTLSDGATPLEHRAVLGSIMALGIDRAVMGDILITDKHRAIIFIKTDFCNYFESNLLKIGRENCSLSKATVHDLNLEKKTSVFSVSIASLRLDCVAAAAAKTSREKAVELIKAKKVFLNRKETCDPSKCIKEGDQIVIRGHGKFNLKSVNGTTRKGRIAAEIEKYI